MKKITALSATLLVAATAAFASPVFAQDHHRGGDRHESHRGDRDGDRDRYRDGDRHDRYRDGGGHDRYRGHGYGYRDDHRRVQPPRIVYRPAYTYIAPRGYAVSRWRVGGRMPAPFYVSRYYVDPYAYQLRLPPRGYRWVRVDRDAYMVSMASGVIADVLYGVFR